MTQHVLGQLFSLCAASHFQFFSEETKIEERGSTNDGIGTKFFVEKVNGSGKENKSFNDFFISYEPSLDQQHPKEKVDSKIKFFINFFNS